MTNKEALDKILGEHSSYQYLKTMRGKVSCWGCLFKEHCDAFSKEHIFESCGVFINNFLDAEVGTYGKGKD